MPQNTKNKSFKRIGPQPLGLHMLMAAGKGAETVQGFLKGLKRYRSSSFERIEPDYIVFYSWERVVLYDCGGCGQPVLLVPSMINKSYILDLAPDVSLVQHLKDEGFHVFMMDWGEPDGENLTIDQVVGDYLLASLSMIYESYGKVKLLGYCMGGLLALAATCIGEKYIDRLVLVATPWDFSKTKSAEMLLKHKAKVEAYLSQASVVSADVMQTHFESLNPAASMKRLLAYGVENNDGHVRRLSYLEDWLSDCVDVDLPIAKSVVLDCYIHNKPMENEWIVAGRVVDPSRLSVKSLFVIPQKDMIVPVDSAEALAHSMKDSTIHYYSSGHVGVMAGRNCKYFYINLTEWLCV